LIVAQQKNLAAKGIFGVRVPLRFFFSFRLNKNNPAIFYRSIVGYIPKILI